MGTTVNHLRCKICNLEMIDRGSLTNPYVCPVHCSKCNHDRKFEDYLDFCSICEKEDGPCKFNSNTNSFIERQK